MANALLWLALALTPAAHAAPAATGPGRTTSPTSSARAALVGDWRVLGPASQAHLTQMIRLTVQALPPTEAAFTAARLDADQASQVRAGRERLAREPGSEAVQGLKKDWIQLDSARAEVTSTRITLRFGDTTEVFDYTVVHEEGIRMQVRMDGPEGPQEVLFTVVDPNTLMFGPMGSEPTVLYRLSAP